MGYILCCHDNLPSVLLEEVAFSGEVTVLLENTKCMKTAAEDVIAMSLGTRLPSLLFRSLSSHLFILPPFPPSLSTLPLHPPPPPPPPHPHPHYLAVIA